MHSDSQVSEKTKKGLFFYFINEILQIYERPYGFFKNVSNICLSRRYLIVKLRAANQSGKRIWPFLAPIQTSILYNFIQV